MKVIVASANPAKVRAVAQALQQIWPEQVIDCSGKHTASGVAAQPMTSGETLQGALNRLASLRLEEPTADYYVAIEAGMDGDCSFAWVTIQHRGKISKTRSASLPIPPQALTAIQHGEELGDVMDRMFAQTNVKQQGGAIAMLTNHLLTRSGVYQQAIILAMIPFIKPELF